MANPQPDKFTRISNELYEAIMQTDFSKRQRNILDLVVRMSYGCQKKFAILKPSDFELVGVGKNHIRAELRYLVQANVLFIDGDVIQINKDYEQWRVSMVKNFDQEKFNRVLVRNLFASEEVPEMGTDVPEMGIEVPEMGTAIENSQVPEVGIEVPKTVTKVPVTGSSQNGKFPKQELDSSQNGNSGVPKTGTVDAREPNNDAAFGDPKYNIKDNIKTISSGGSGDIRAREGELFRAFEDNFLISSSAIQREKLASYLDDGMEPELILKAITITRENGKDLNYLWGVLNRMLERGIKTLESYEFYERKRRDDHAAYRNRPRGHPRENRDIEAASSGYYAGIGKRL